MIGRTVAVMLTYVAVGLLLAVAMPTHTDLVQSESPESVLRPGAKPAASWTSARVERSDGSPVPTFIEVPAIGVSARIVPAGLDVASGQMEVPPADEVGWYRFGPLPGEAGSAVLAGHVDVPGATRGVFFDLDRLEQGSEVVIHMSDGRAHTYRVVDTTRVAKADLDLERVFANTGPSRVTLVTCGGAFNETEHSYSDNVVSELRPAEKSA
jgi:LPXTG-site transpeptidase (sortase) family protein